MRSADKKSQVNLQKNIVKPIKMVYNQLVIKLCTQ